MNATEKFGTILKEIRRSRGLTQEELAGRMNRSVDAVSQWERGINWPTYQALIELSDALDVPVAEFFGTKGEQSDRRVQLSTEMAVLIRNLSDSDLVIAVEQVRLLTRRG